MQDTSPLYLTPATFNDFAFIEKVFAAMIPQYAPIMPGSFEANLENLRRLQEKGFDFTATGLTGYLVETDKAAIGFIALGPLSPRLAYLSAFYFLPEYQRQGHGKKALQQIENTYQNLGFQEILLLVHQKAPWASNFYRKMGYKTLAEHRASIIQYAGVGIEHLLEPGLFLMGRTLKRRKGKTWKGKP
jgi:ribosomal protein S18 acetylase RimI-like enzyme